MNYALPETFVETRYIASLHCFSLLCLVGEIKCKILTWFVVSGLPLVALGF